MTSALSAVAVVPACLREGVYSKSYLDLGGGHSSISQLWLNCTVAGDNHVSIWFIKTRLGVVGQVGNTEGKAVNQTLLWCPFEVICVSLNFGINVFK